MIPWVREKFAERRARWLAARNKRGNTLDKHDEVEVITNTTITTNTIAATTTRRETPASSNSSPNNASRITIIVPQQPQQQQQPNTTVNGTLETPLPRINGCTAMNCRVFATPQPIRSTSKIKTSRRSSATSSSINEFNSDNLTNSRSHAKERIKVRIVCPSARLLAFQIDPNKRLAELKSEIILELADDPISLPLFATDIRQLGPRYRLFRAEYEGTELNEQLTLAQLHICENDTLVLVARRSQLQQLAAQTRETHAPREQDIDASTRNVPEHHVEMPMVDINEIFQQSNLQFDVRKVLISLAQASASVIGTGPYANRLIAMLKQKLINKRNYQSETLQCLVDMGFKKEKAEYAFKLQNGVYSAALEWLLVHQSEEMPIEEAAMGMPKSQSVSSPSGIISNDSIVENTKALLEIVRIYSHRDMPPSPETVGSLVEMGFEENDVLDALRKTCNNKAAACEWLCGNRTGSLIELRDGLAQDSPILKSILELPQVQMNLSNPKILLAFLSILENENSIRVWSGDNDTTSVITHILQKYHEEKHVLGINQFYSNR